jgi:hypothetical protein
MTGKSKVVLRKHIFIEKSCNSFQSTAHTWTVHGPRTELQKIVFLVNFLIKEFQNAKNACGSPKKTLLIFAELKNLTRFNVVQTVILINDH